MRAPELPDLPSLPSLPDVTKPIGIAVDGAKKLAGKVADVTGISTLARSIENEVVEIRTFAEHQIDSILNMATAGLHEAESFMTQSLHAAENEVLAEVSKGVALGKEVLQEIEQVPDRARVILAEGERVIQRAKKRRDLTRRWQQRLRERRQQAPRIVSKHIQILSLMLEAELEADGLEALQSGGKAQADTQMAFDKTVNDARRFSTELIRQTSENQARAIQIKTDLKNGVHSAESWVTGHVDRVKSFRSERAREAGNIRSVAQARTWVEGSVQGAHNLATLIKDDAVKKPAEVKVFASQKVGQAMALAKSARAEVETAKNWLDTQKGTNALWRKQMIDIKRAQEDSLKGHGIKLLATFAGTGGQIVGELEALGEDEIRDTAKEIGGTVSDVRKSIDEFKGTSARDYRALAVEVAGPVQGELPESEHEPSEHTLKVTFPERSEFIAVEEGGVPKPPPRKRSGREPSLPRERPATSLEERPPKPEIKPKAKKPVTHDKPPMDEPAPGTPKPEVTVGQPKVGSKGGSSATVHAKKGETLSKANEARTPEERRPAPPALEAKPKHHDPAEHVSSRVKSGESTPAIPVISKEPAKPKAAIRNESGAKEGTPATGAAPGPGAAKRAATGPVSPKAVERPKATKALGALMPPGTVVKPEAASKKVTPKNLAATRAAQPAAVQRKKAAGPDQPEDPKAFQAKLLAAGGTGSPPDPATRGQLSKHVGFDPSMVRLHTGPSAAAAAKSVQADAFTIGKDIFFAEGKYDPTSPQGLGLIGHEVTHVGQQLGLRGDKLRFITKTGGDAMEQEAQEVGERIVSNLGHGSSLRIGRYIRIYEPADDQPITPGLQVRLDKLSMDAMRRAARVLSTLAKPMARRIDEVNVSISLDLEELSDAEAVDIWAEAIVAAVEAAQSTVRSGFDVAEDSVPVTHLLQRRLGDPGEKSAAEPKKDVDPAVLAKMAKITASAQDREMIRSLLIRQDVDPMIEAGKAKKRKQEAEEQALDDKPRSSNSHVNYSGHIHPDAIPGIEAKLKEAGINSLDDFEKLKKDFVAAFNQKGYNVTSFILDQNKEIVEKQTPRYLSRDSKNPDAQINKLKKAAQAVLDAMNPYMGQIRKVFGGVVSVSPANLDTIDELLLRQTASGDLHCTDAEAKELSAARDSWVKVRREQGNEHVILLGRDFDPNFVLSAKGDEDLELKMVKYFIEVQDNIKYARERLSLDKFWELQPMVDLTKKQLGIHAGDGADKTIQEAAAGKASDAAVMNAIMAGAAIVLAVTAMVATGGLASVALIGSAGLSVYGAAKHADEYAFKMAAANSALDQAKLISKDEPALFWLALDLVAAGLDLGAAVGAFNALAKIAKTAVAEKSALKELEAAARAEFKKLPGMKMNEEQFVERLLESAKKGVKGAEDSVKQIRILTELIEATTPRAAAILKGDQAAIKSLVMEYGNWKGLMGALKNGGEDASKMAEQIKGFREGIIKDLKARGASPLEDASTDAASDYDLNVKPEGTEGAGERVLKFEKEMSDKFGKNWSEALLMNFYTDKSQLLSVEQALKAVSPTKRAAIMKTVTDKAEKLNFAKMLEHAGDDEKAIAQVKEMMNAAGVKYSVEDLHAIAKEVQGRGRDVILKEVDADIAALEKLKAGDPKRVELAEQITLKQMEANFLSTEAYIGPAAVKGGPLTNAEAYQSAMSQLEMMQHVMGSSGGDVVKACREYEFFKYINRYVAAAKKAGVETPGMNYFEGLSAYVYKRARSAHMETGGFPGVGPADEAATGLVDDAFLIDQYNAFRKEVNESLPKIKAAADKNPAGGWQVEMKQPRPAAGAPPGGNPPEPAPPAGPPGGSVPGAKTTGPTVTLPSAAAKSVAAAKKIAGSSGTTVPEGSLDPSKRVTSAGFSGSGQGTGVGVFKTTIPGVPHEVIVKMYPKGMADKMEQELGAAIAAEKTGIGPKVFGKVNGKATVDAPERVGFAMDEVKGGFADAYAATDDAAKLAANKADMMKNAANITPATFADLENFRNGMFKEGYYYRGELQGFVDSDGKWKPVDVQGAEPISTATSVDDARKIHDQVFDEMRDTLMQRSLEARAAAAKQAKPGGQ